MAEHVDVKNICSRGNWVDLWTKYQVGVTKYI